MGFGYFWGRPSLGVLTDIQVRPLSPHSSFFSSLAAELCSVTTFITNFSSLSFSASHYKRTQPHISSFLKIHTYLHQISQFIPTRPLLLSLMSSDFLFLSLWFWFTLFMFISFFHMNVSTFSHQNKILFEICLMYKYMHTTTVRLVVLVLI